MSEPLTPSPRPAGDTQKADPATPSGCQLGGPPWNGEGRIVTFTDVTDPRAAGQHATVRTLADEAGNRYVLLTTAQYLRLLVPRLPAKPVSGFMEVNDHGDP